MLLYWWYQNEQKCKNTSEDWLAQFFVTMGTCEYKKCPKIRKSKLHIAKLSKEILKVCFLYDLLYAKEVPNSVCEAWWVKVQLYTGQKYSVSTGHQLKYCLLLKIQRQPLYYLTVTGDKPCHRALLLFIEAGLHIVTWVMAFIWPLSQTYL